MADILDAIAHPVIGNALDQAQKIANLQNTQANTLQTKIQTDNASIEGDQSLQTLQLKRADAVAGVLGSILADPNPTRSSVLSKIDDGVKNGIYTAQGAAIAKQNVTNLPDDPESLRSFARQKLIQFTPHLEAMQATGAPVSMHNVGGSDVPLAMPGVANPNQTPSMNGQPVGGLTRTFTPGEANQIVELKQPGTGRPVQVRNADIPGWAASGYQIDSNGHPVIAGGPASPAPTVMSPNGGSPRSSSGLSGAPQPGQQKLLGLLPGASAPALAGQPTPPPAAAAGPTTAAPQTAQPTQSRLIPTEQDNALFKENMAAHNQDVRDVNNPGFMAQQQALQSIVNIDGSNMGKGAGWVRDVKLVVRDLLPSVAKSIGITNVDDTQMALKSMARVALAAGNKTDYELLTSQAANPSKDMPLPVAQAVSRTIIGLNNMHRAVVNETNNQAQNATALDLKSQPQSLRADMMNKLDLNGFTPGLKLSEYLKTLPPAGTPAGDAARAKLSASLKLQSKYSQPNGGSLPNPGGP